MNSGRAALRTDADLAARVLAPSWPIDTFIAINPLGGLEDRPFGQAVRISERTFGARGTLTEPEFRSAYGRGRITAVDLRAALARRFPGLQDQVPLQLGDRTVLAEDVLLADLHHGRPAQAPERSLRSRAEREAPEAAASVDAQAARWCAAYLDRGQASWAMPGRDRGLYAAWRELAPRERGLGTQVRARLAELPARADDAALDALAALGVEPVERRAYLRAHLTRLPGWAAYLRGRDDREGTDDLLGYLALRLAYEAALLGADGEGAPEASQGAGDDGEPSPAVRARVTAELLAGREPALVTEVDALAGVLAPMSPSERCLIWLDAYEGHYRDDLLGVLETHRPATAGDRPAAQVVCCIDARSEGLRRHLEALGPYETLGFAGFFAVAVRFTDLRGGAPSALCPVLIEARNPVAELPVEEAVAQARRRLVGERVIAGAQDGFHTAKGDLAAPFALAEAAGWVAGPLAAGKTLMAGRYGRLRAGLRGRAAPPVPTRLTVAEGFALEERAMLGEVALTMMGLTENFGRLVVFCGHGSTTENNPYQAALDCGACGGQRGAPNARTAAAILNGDDVREHLAAKGRPIPEDTWFVAAEHDTATDRVELLDEHLVPESHRADLAPLHAALEEAGDRLSVERCVTLPGAPSRPDGPTARRHVQARSSDWAQVFPEWGLAGNAAFLVGPRSMTRGLDLGRRTFLHSYEAAVDPDGAALETILTAPLVVAQWISCQYYFSSVDPDVFGSGTKTIHNVVGAVGVLAGQDGDLQPGLPWQSVGVGEELVHEPMRLLAAVQAPLETIDRIVARNPILQQLFGNAWVALAAREHPGEGWLRHTPDGWTSWTTTKEHVA